MTGLLAHEKWFTEERPGFDAEFLLSPLTLGLLAAAVVVAVAWRLAAARLPTPELPFLRPLGRLAPWVPRLLAIHAGVSLLAQASRGTYLAPSMGLGDGPVGTSLAIVEGLVGVWLITGFRIRPAAILLVAAGPLGMPVYGVASILERADLLGIALFLAILPPADSPGGAVDADDRTIARAVLALRVLVGVALIVVAFTEKLAYPDLAQAFLDRYPAFDISQALVPALGELDFIRIAGAIEVLLGLLLISGAAPQAVVIVAGIPFNATLFFLGTPELIGHLPIYGAMLALLVYGSDPRAAREVPLLDPRALAA